VFALGPKHVAAMQHTSPEHALELQSIPHVPPSQRAPLRHASKPLQTRVPFPAETSTPS
jgi:hypothetical protein